MRYILAIFGGRTQTMAFYQILRSYNISCSVVNTPKQAIVACGISVKFMEKDISVVSSILQRRKFDTFVGIYRVFASCETFVISPI